jgi:hypothetical protein
MNTRALRWRPELADPADAVTHRLLAAEVGRLRRGGSPRAKWRSLVAASWPDLTAAEFKRAVAHAELDANDERVHRLSVLVADGYVERALCDLLQ